MTLLRRFSGYIPAAEFAHRIVGPPSSMLTIEQKNASRDDELSFRHVVGRGAGAPYSEAMAWLRRCMDHQAIQRVESAVIVHRLRYGNLTATGLLAEVSVAGYEQRRVKGHESTIAKTELKMLDYMQSTRIFGNPVALAHKDQPAVTATMDQHTEQPADLVFESSAGTHHQLWVVGGPEAEDLCEHFVEDLYVTDGHHRLAAASSLAKAEGMQNAYLPAALYSESEQQLGTYSRAITDNSIEGRDVIASLHNRFELKVSTSRVPRPAAPHQIGVRVDGQSFIVSIPPQLVPDDAYARLDANLLQDLVLEPLFGVTDPRTDSRLEFVADTGDAAHDPDGCDAWFLPYSASVAEVMAVADRGLAMPPKSTYFMPKVPSGLMIRTVDEA